MGFAKLLTQINATCWQLTMAFANKCLPIGKKLALIIPSQEFSWA
jgi:hypothetical protein